MITIRHTHADGTLVEGTRRGDGTAAILKSNRLRWFPSLSQWGIAQSRDKHAQTARINTVAAALREAGYDVTVEIDETVTRSFAEAEQERTDRAEDRAVRMAGYSASAARRSAAGAETARRIMDSIPMGQPILVGHHSERRHRKDLARIDRGLQTAADENRKAEHFAHRTANAENYQASREDVPRTLRRIEKLQADLRVVERELDGVAARVNRVYQREIRPAAGARREQLLQRQADLTDQLTYWQGVVQRARDSGVKVWGRADFQPGDFVCDGSLSLVYEVLRVNAKSLTVPDPVHLIGRTKVISREAAEQTAAAMHFGMHTRTLPYDNVHGRMTAAEVAAQLRTESMSASSARSPAPHFVHQVTT